MTDAVRHIPITRLKGVGPAQSQKLEKLGIRTLQDLLLHLPHRFEDRTKITPIFDLKLDQGAVIEGEIMTSKIQFGRRASLSPAIPRTSDCRRGCTSKKCENRD